MARADAATRPEIQGLDRRDHRRFLVGAAPSSGLAALAAERGGADFLLALSAGRLRAMGLPSIACMLPVAAANELALRFAEEELLHPTRTPLFVGLTPLDASVPLSERVEHAANIGISGIANFPSATQYPDTAAQALEAQGSGFYAELELLRAAAERGLRTLALVRTREQADAAAALQPDLLCVNFGWNAGGRLSDLQPEVSIDEAILLARDIARIVQRRAPATIRLVGGGPVLNPSQVAEVCVESGMQGYVGGSTIDRLPTETAIVDATLAFKSAGLTRRRERGERAALLSEAAAVGLHGGSEALVAALRQLQALAEPSGPVVVSGPPGTQRHAALAFVQREAGFPGNATTVLASDHTELQLGIQLFGHGDKSRGLLVACDGEPLIIETLEGISHRWQRKLARLLSRGMATPFRGNHALATRPWLLLLTEASLDELLARNAILPELHEQLRAREVRMPTLAERLDGLGDIIAGYCTSRGLDLSFTDSAVALLQQRAWHGNIPELERLIDRVRAAGFRGEVSASALEPLVAPESHSAPPPRGRDRTAAEEAEWLLAGLRQNAFNRSATARALGISRKTLYNRMRRLGL